MSSDARSDRFRAALCEQHDDPWRAAMLRGDFASAWRISDAILEQRRRSGERCLHWPRHLQFVWSGAPLAGKRVLVRCYHGLGDTIQFVRLVGELRKQAREVILWVQPGLMQLLHAVRGIDRILPLHDGAPEVDYDVDIELMELAHALRVRPDALGADVPYLFVPPAAGSFRSPGFRHVGLAWRSGAWDASRSIPDELLAAHLNGVDNVRWYSLQYDADEMPLAATPLACEDIFAMASRMQTLDVIISVDTIVAHLAGALGLPVWTLLRKRCDWRWMSDRNDSPWYPTMRLFRQHVEGDWSSVLDEVAAALRVSQSAAQSPVAAAGLS